jgi:ubiquinone/menaquinone biosynthesis C-methylase UbiE
MSGKAAQFIGDIPRHYDEGLGPHIFADYAAEIAKRAAATKPHRVLELAAGTGIVSRQLRNALPEATELVVTDLNGPMLEIAKAKFRPGENVSFKVADAMALPFESGTFDLIVCQFGVMFFPDKIAAFREAERVLKRGGRYLFNVWGSKASNPFARIASDATSRFFPVDPPGFYRVPFGYHDIEGVTADVAQAGFSKIMHETIIVTKEVKDWPLFARGLVYGNPIIAEIEARATSSPEQIQAAIVATLRQTLGAEPTTMPLEAIFFSCCANAP